MADTDSSHRLARLERRLERERRARAEAEQIAEAGMRSLYDANQELDRRILERTAELHRALEVAESANNAKSSFLAQMSHQLYTPLNGMLGMLELLAGELTDEQAREWHASAMRSARRLERLATRLITYVELENVDLRGRNEGRALSEVLTAAYDRWHGRCLRSGQLLVVELQSAADARIPGPREVDVLFDELLSNVVEHAGPGSVTISARPGSERGWVIVEIADPGTGLDSAAVDRAHNLNALPDQTKRGDHPVNLGIALVDRIVAGLGGSWGPVDDGRSAVSLTLPVDDQPMPGAAIR